jgi:prevent-host-death family protein
MEKDYTITEASRDLAAMVRAVERTGSARITRRGRPVAMLLSIAEFESLLSARRKEPDWSVLTLDTRGFKFDRDESHRR